MPPKRASTGRKKKNDESTVPVGLGEFKPMKRREHQMKINIPAGIDPTVLGASDWFQLLWQDSDWENLVKQTNAYAKKIRKKDDDDQQPRPMGRRWKPVSKPEMKAFVAITIVMGVHRVRDYSDVWRKEMKIKLGMKKGKAFGVSGFGSLRWRIPLFYSSALPKNRYTAIKRYLHISDPDNTYTDAEWFKKVEPLNSTIRRRFQEVVVPASDVTVDEMMIRFHGRSKHSVRMPKKPIKQGFKIFAICQRGYTYNWLFHSRINGTAELDFTTQFAATQSVVYQLALSLPHDQGYHFNVYMDNLFTTVPLLSALRDAGIAGTGTARSNAFPSSAKKLSDSVPWNTVDSTVVGGGSVLAIEWRDQKTVQMLTTLHSVTEKVSKNRRQLRNTSTNGVQIRRTITTPRMTVNIPTVINDYNSHKGGVDIADQYRESYFTQQTARCNWLPLFYWLVDITSVNFFLLVKNHFSPYVEGTRQKFCISHKQFWLEIAAGLIDMPLKVNLGRKLVRNRTTAHSRKTDNLCYSKHFGIQEVPATCPHRWVVRTGKCRECVVHRMEMRENGIKSDKRAPLSIWSCEQCKLFFCIKCLEKFQERGNGEFRDD